MYKRAVVIPIRTDTDPQLRSVNGKISTATVTMRTWSARTAAQLSKTESRARAATLKRRSPYRTYQQPWYPL
jgi:hypothetical protein